MKIIKNKPESSSMLIAGEGYTQITSGPMSITADTTNGIFLSGPVSITSGVDNIKIGGIFKLNPLMMTGLPSTMITPIPTLIFDIPVAKVSSIKGIASLITGI